MACIHCGAPDDGIVTRHGLVAHRDPYRVNYRGKRLDLTMRPAEMLYMLVKFGRMSYEVIHARMSDNSMRAYIAMIKKHLPSGISLRVIHGWGYELVLDDQPNANNEALGGLLDH